MAYFKEKGICNSWFEYQALPLGVVIDARLLAEGEVHKQQREAMHNAPSAPRRARSLSGARS